MKCKCNSVHLLFHVYQVQATLHCVNNGSNVVVLDDTLCQFRKLFKSLGINTYDMTCF